MINGKATSYKTRKGYAVFDHEFKQGDIVIYSLSKSTRHVEANKKIADDLGKIFI